ncbi:Ig-like domain-containing protein, partial [Levilactobacillus spicheri]
MEKVVKKRLVLTVTAAAVCVLGLPTIGQAATISATGLQNNDATVTDTTGQPVTGNYSQWENYQVNYQWSVLNSVKVANGDTTTVTLPDGLTANSTLDLPLVTKTGQTVGTFTIQKGATSGTITFNGRPSNTDNLAGTLSLYTQGTTGSTHIHNDWSINKIGWIVNRNPTGQPTLLTWNVAFNAASQSLGNVTITDTLGPNQTYVPGSVVATDGAYDSTGTLVSDGQAATPAVTTAGNQLTFLFTNVNTAVNMTYNAIPTITGTGQVWTNNAAISGKDAGNVTAQIAWGGAGSASDNLIPVATPSDPTTPSDPATTTSTTGTSTATSTSAAKTPSNPVTP